MDPVSCGLISTNIDNSHELVQLNIYLDNYLYPKIIYKTNNFHFQKKKEEFYQGKKIQYKHFPCLFRENVFDRTSLNAFFSEN